MDLLHEIDPPPPVVIVYSAFEYFPLADVQEAVGAKVFRYLKKPVSPQEVLAVLADAVVELESL